MALAPAPKFCGPAAGCNIKNLNLLGDRVQGIWVYNECDPLIFRAPDLVREATIYRSCNTLRHLRAAR
jgi:hypothetical protein